MLVVSHTNYMAYVLIIDRYTSPLGFRTILSQVYRAAIGSQDIRHNNNNIIKWLYTM